MSIQTRILVVGGLLSALLTACSEEKQPQAVAVSKPFEAQTQALEQAKQLEQSMQQAADTQRQAIEAQLK